MLILNLKIKQGHTTDRFEAKINCKLAEILFATLIIY